MEESRPTVKDACITGHEGFDVVCLNGWVLQAAYFAYRQHYGTRDVRDQSLHEYVTVQLHHYKTLLKCPFLFFTDAKGLLHINSLHHAGFGGGLEGKPEWCSQVVP